MNLQNLNESLKNTALGNTNMELSYLLLRQTIGALTFLLPILLVLGAILEKSHETIQPSISDYYYSSMHLMFVGLLFSICFFMLCYNGSDQPKYNIVPKISGVLAFLVALFPTSSNNFRGSEYISCNSCASWFTYAHFTSAVALFISLMYFCFVIFQLPDSVDRNDSRYFVKKNRRNLIYKICGIAIGVSIAIMAVLTGLIYLKIIVRTGIFLNYFVLIFESTSLFAVGLSWLVKGSTLWPHSRFFIKRILVQGLR